MKHYVNFALLISFSALIASAFLRFFLPFSLATTRVHIVFGSLVLFLVGLHLASRLSYFPKMLSQARSVKSSQPKPIRLLLLPTLLCAYLLAASLLDWWPASQLISVGYEARNRSIIFRPEEGTADRALPNRYQVKRQTSDAASILVDIEWGSAFDPNAEFQSPFSKNRPQIAIWAESSAGALVETFFVSEESAFSESYEWAGNERRRVDILPIWRHQFTLASGVEPDGAADTFSGSTPEHSFSIESYLGEEPDGFYLCVEVNAPKDSNDFYHSHQEETAKGYALPGIGQPSTYYSAFIDPTENRSYYLADFVGHGGSASQQSGSIHYDSSQLTTAHDLIEKILVRIQRP